MPYLPEVVRIIAAHVQGPMGGKAIGTGFFLHVDGVHIKEEGLLLTNAHVVTNSPVVKIMTTYIEHQALPVTVVSLCHDRDLALLKVEPQVQQWLKRTLRDRYGLDHIPSLGFGDSDQLRTGFQVHAVGHPLGLVDQQFTTGVYQGPVHLNSEIRGLTSATINGGNSGGPLLGTFIKEDVKEVEYDGLHYFTPSRYKLMGINTFKLTGANVDGENGFIHANTVLKALPTLMKPLESRYKRESKVMSNLQKVMKQSTPVTSAAAVQALQDHLTEKDLETLETSNIEKTWAEKNFGGLSRGQPRTFVSWVARHVFNPQSTHMHRGGPELVSKVLEFASNGDWNALAEWKGKRRWHEVRADTTPTNGPEMMPAVVRFLPPTTAHVHSPQLGITSHPMFAPDLLVHYQCPKNEQQAWVANGGVVVTHVAPNSLYAHAGGQEGDIVYRFQATDTEAELTPGGTWYSKKRDLPMSLVDLCNDVPIGEKITLSALRMGGETVEVSFQNREPSYDELPPIRQTYAFCDEGKYEAKQKAQVQGIIFAPLRLSHVSAFKLFEYMPLTKRYEFKVVVENVSPESPAYSIDALHAGVVVTHINDNPVATNWEEFIEQISKPHSETGCWAIDTEYNGQKSKYVMVSRKVQAK
jgi:S1-C subfamily serine protease